MNATRCIAALLLLSFSLSAATLKLHTRHQVRDIVDKNKFVTVASVKEWNAKETALVI